MEPEEVDPKRNEQAQDRLPPPGPEYLISETGFGPTGVQESESENEQGARGWKLKFWPSDRSESTSQ